MKRLSAFIIAAVFVVSLTSCAENGHSAQTPDTVTSTSAAPAAKVTDAPEASSQETTAPPPVTSDENTSSTRITPETTAASSPEAPASSASSASPAATTASGYKSAEELNVYYSQQAEKYRDVCDALYFHAEDNVKLTLFRCEDHIFAYCTDPLLCPWEQIYTEDIALENGEFAFLTADAVFESGGIDGRCNRPQIRRIINFEKTDLRHADEYSGFPVWSEGYKENGAAVIYNAGEKQYFLFRCRVSKPVTKPDGSKGYDHYNGWFAYLDGELTGYYEYGRYTFDDVITVLSGEKLVTDGYEVTIRNRETLAIFRAGDTYYSFGTSIFLNAYPTPLYNEQLENKLPEGYELNDGECAKMCADIKLLNGQGAVNVPMISKVHTFKACGYDAFIDRLAMAPIREYETRGQNDFENVMFDRTAAGTWLIIVENDKYLLYLENYTGGKRNCEFIGSSDSLTDAVAVIDSRKRQ